jgi:hypothetical protein
MPMDEDEISRIDHEAGSLPEDDDRIAAQQAVDRHENSAAKR